MDTVYIASNTSFPDLLKIGMTTRTAEEHIKSLSNTSVPTPFMLEAAIETFDGLVVQQLAHKILAKHRVTPSREFFKCTVEEAETAIRRATMVHDAGVWQRALDVLATPAQPPSDPYA